MKVLLDTCALIWLAAEPKRLSRAAASCLNQPETELWFSHAGVWEIHLKWRTGKLQLPSPPRAWINEQLVWWNIETLPIDLESLHRTSELPDHHSDPFDRMLIAQAIIRQMTIVTPDSWVRKYPVQTLW